MSEKKDRKEYQRQYQREWLRKRRKEWFDKNGPCVKCKSTERLQLDHIDWRYKIASSVWSWSDKRRITELLKCQVLCAKCHRKKTKRDIREQGRKGKTTGTKIPREKIMQYLDLIESGLSTRKAAVIVGISRGTLSTMQYQIYWREIVAFRASVKAAHRPVKT